MDKAFFTHSAIRLKNGNLSEQYTAQLPASKSISNRLLVLQNLSKGKIELRNLSTANDTLLLKNALENSDKEIFIDDAGTAGRFILSWACVQNQERIIDGSARMRKRPYQPLIDALRKLGFKLKCLKQEGYLPIKIEPVEMRLIGRETEIDASVSSQFVSSLCLIAPFLPKGLELNLVGKKSSWPYVQMTLNLLLKSGVDVLENSRQIDIKPNPNLSANIYVENDWSAAAFWYQIALFSGKKILLNGLNKQAIQGDLKVVELFQNLGVKSVQKSDGILLERTTEPNRKETVDFTNIPDLAQAYIMACKGLKLSHQFFGLESLRVKETDRITALQNELNKVGSQLVENRGVFSLEFNDNNHVNPPRFSTYKDHRMAMCLAPLVLLLGEVIIENPSVVKKSYPNFWEHLQQFGIEISPCK